MVDKDGQINKPPSDGLSKFPVGGNFYGGVEKMSEYMTLKEVSTTLGVSPRTVDRILRARKLPYIRISRQYRINRKHFDKFIEKNTRNIEAIDND